MRIKVPYCVHLDVTVDTASGKVERVEILGETVFLNRDNQGFPLLNADDEALSISEKIQRRALIIAEGAEWPAWDNG